MTRNSWYSQQQGHIRLEDKERSDGSVRKPAPVPKAALEEGILQLLASAAEMQQRQDLDSALQLYQAAMEKVKENGLNRKRLFIGINKKPPPLNSRTPLEWCLHVGDMASAICLLGNPNAALTQLRTKVSLERVEQVLDAGADIEHRIGPCGRTLLLQEAAEGRHAGIRLALDRGANVHCMDDNGDTALALSVPSERPQADLIVADLLEARANLNIRNGQGQLLFQIAIANAQPAVLKRVIAVLSPLTAEQQEIIQIWAAGLPGHDKKWSSRTCDVLRMLLRHGLDPNLRFQRLRYQGQGTSTLLEVAIEQQAVGSEALIVELLEMGAEPNLQAALQSGSIRVIELVLAKVTPVTEINHQQMAAWMKSLRGDSRKWRERDIEVLKLLLENGLNPDLCHPKVPRSPLIICAASNGNLGLVLKLIAHNAKLDVKNDDADTALICAAKNHHRQVYDALKAAGLNDKYFLFGTVWGNYAGS